MSLAAFAVTFVYSAQAFGDMGLQSLKANVVLAASTTIAARLVVNTGAWPKRVVRKLGPAPEPQAGPTRVADEGGHGRAE